MARHLFAFTRIIFRIATENLMEMREAWPAFREKLANCQPCYDRVSVMW